MVPMIAARCLIDFYFLEIHLDSNFYKYLIRFEEKRLCYVKKSWTLTPAEKVK